MACSTLMDHPDKPRCVGVVVVVRVAGARLGEEEEEEDGKGGGEHAAQAATGPAGPPGARAPQGGGLGLAKAGGAFTVEGSTRISSAPAAMR